MVSGVAVSPAMSSSLGIRTAIEKPYARGQLRPYRGRVPVSLIYTPEWAGAQAEYLALRSPRADSSLAAPLASGCASSRFPTVSWRARSAFWNRTVRKSERNFAVNLQGAYAHETRD